MTEQSEILARSLLQSLTPEDLKDPDLGMPKVLKAFDQAVAEVEERHQKAHLLETLIRTQYLTREEATRLVDNLKEHPLQYEAGPCRLCKGSGLKEESQCFGVRRINCSACQNRNSTKKIRVRLFWDPHGDPITFFDEVLKHQAKET